MGLFTTDKDFFGLDIGNSAVRLVQLKKGGSRPSLVAYGKANIPVGIAQSDSKIDLQNLAQIIKELTVKTRVSTKNVVVALPGSAVFTAVVKLPYMTQAELAKAIQYQAEQNIPLKLKDVKIDWQVIKQDPATKEMAVMIIAAPSGKVDKMLTIMDFAGLEVESLETSPIAMARSLISSTDPLVMILDIGATSTEMAIVENGVISHTRSLPAAGQAFTRAISQNLGLDPEQADQFKMRFGLSQDKLEGQVYKTIKPILNNIVDEIERSIAFYAEQFGGNVSKIVLSGGSARLPEMINYLKSELKIEVQLGNPWAFVSYPANFTEQLQSNSFDFGVAVGLAMRDN